MNTCLYLNIIRITKTNKQRKYLICIRKEFNTSYYKFQEDARPLQIPNYIPLLSPTQRTETTNMSKRSCIIPKINISKTIETLACISDTACDMKNNMLTYIYFFCEGIARIYGE